MVAAPSKGQSMPVSILTWKPLKHGFRARTKQFTLNTRQHFATPLWSWTVHRRGGVPGGRRLEAHGREDDSEKAMRVHQNEQDAAQPASVQPAQSAIAHPEPPAPLPCVHFVGAESTGKTTLCRYVRKHYGLKMLGETARTVVSEQETDFGRIRSSGEASSAYQADVFARQLQAELGTPAPYVSDRGPDNLAYASEYARNFVELYASVPDAYVTRLQRSVVFLVRPNAETFSAGLADPVRAKMKWEGLQRIDAKVEMLLQLMSVTPILIE
ncbi:ATP-binding protein, partial [bacterium]|nr:ATP-binding protein [bacterium]